MTRGLYKRKGSPFWQWSGRIRGVRVRVSLRTRDRLTAEECAKLYNACVDLLNSETVATLTGVTVPTQSKSPLSLRAVLEAYLDRARRDARRESTVRGYELHARTILRAMGEETRARNLLGRMGLARLRRYVEGREARGVSPRTIRAELRTLSAAWTHAQATGMIPGKVRNPIESAQGIRPARSLATRAEIFTGNDELDEFRRTCTDQPLLEFLLMARFTGLRASEIGRVLWEDIDLDAAVLRWENRKAGGSAGTSRVQVRALTQHAVDFLRGMGTREAEGRPGHPFISVAQQRYRWARWVRAHPEHRDRRYQPQALRHRLNSLLLSAGLATKEVQIFLGHTTPDMTHIRYAHDVRTAESLGGYCLDSP